MSSHGLSAPASAGKHAARARERRVNLLEAMRIYVRVVERGSISGAARDLDIGQPAVSERIERLEKYLGCQLLLRNARTFQCTPEGSIFHERSKTVLGAVEQALAEVANDEQIVKGTIRIAAPHCFGETILPEGLKRVMTDYPRLDIELALNDKIADLVTEGVDISFRLGPLGDSAYIAWPLGQIRRLLVASPAYLKQHDPVVSPAQLVNHSFIRVKGSFDADQLPLSSDANVVESAMIRTAIKTTHWRPMYEMVLAGVGIGVLEEPAAMSAIAGGRLVRVLPAYEVPPLALNLLIRPQRPVPARVRKIVDTLKAFVGEALQAETV
ncbi:DNA-binding transcriptional LysR family regulator [Paraburkholderia bannensis]|uniref:DNA-binding transcriptional LysR family regulator n=1 Tax=Paraburkholderia bannensis TaxID=765414 RepID=A0A7W9U024_9BURK|nr:DNA-binding transcriptional LysR family regulator [Paraburkholderia sp. WP4_3_2]MBB6104319.1 DNA-binding transcriptional LysR family regulator [Paraburkholderia bannensis]